MAATAIDTRLRQKAVSLVAKYGKLVSFAQPSDSYEPDTGIVVTSTKTYSRKITPPTPFSSRYIDGKNILQGDTQCYLPALDLGFTPVIGTKVTIDSIIFGVVQVSPVYSGEQIAIFELQLRR